MKWFFIGLVALFVVLACEIIWLENFLVKEHLGIQHQAQPADTVKAEPVQVDTFPKITGDSTVDINGKTYLLDMVKNKTVHHVLEESQPSTYELYLQQQERIKKSKAKQIDRFSICYDRGDGLYEFQFADWTNEKACLAGQKGTYSGFRTKKDCIETYNLFLIQRQKEIESYLQPKTKKALSCQIETTQVTLGVPCTVYIGVPITNQAKEKK